MHGPFASLSQFRTSSGKVMSVRFSKLSHSPSPIPCGSRSSGGFGTLPRSSWMRGTSISCLFPYGKNRMKRPNCSSMRMACWRTSAGVGIRPLRLRRQTFHAFVTRVWWREKTKESEEGIHNTRHFLGSRRGGRVHVVIRTCVCYSSRGLLQVEHNARFGPSGALFCRHF